jgi:LAO/AO transport system kinase
VSPSASDEPARLLDAARAGERRALARLLSVLERGGAEARAVAAACTGAPAPYVVGITGAPGAGKSTLTDRLIGHARGGWPAEGPEGAQAIDQLAVLAVDPSSPLSGGAILGDRVRMASHATDPSVYIRSLAARGHLGGLSLAVPDALRLLGAVGMPLVLVETVGVGQMEVEVASAADTTVVVLTPGWGDAMQAAKAGLLEVADLFVLNKADRLGVAEARRDLEAMVALSAPGSWHPPVLEAVALEDRGVDQLFEAVGRHRRHLVESGELAVRRRSRLAAQLRRILLAAVTQQVDAQVAGERFEHLVDAVLAGSLDPYGAVDQLLS